MADSQPIKYSQIAGPNLLDPLKKEIEDVNNLLKIATENLKEMISLSSELANSTPLDSYENIQKVEKAIGDTTKAVEELDKVEKDRVKLEERLKDLDDERVQANFNLREQIRLQTKELRDNAKELAAQGNAYQTLVNRTNQAQKRFKALAAEFGANSKQAEEARKEFDRLDEQLREINDAAKDGRRDVGRYEKGVQSLTRTFKTFASATIILKIFELLQSSISANSDGLAELQKIWVRVTTVFEVTARRIVDIFPAIQANIEKLVLNARISFLELTGYFTDNEDEVKELQKQYDALDAESVDLAAAFAGLGAEIEDLTQKKIQLIDDTLAYRREIVGLEKDIADAIPTLEQYRRGFEDDSASLREQIENGVRFREEQQKTFEVQAVIAARRLKLAQENAVANRTSVDAQEELSAATKEYNQLIADQANELAATEREIQKLRDDATQLNLDFYFDDFDNRKTVNERIIADETQTFERRRELLKENQRDAEIANDLRAEALNKSLQERGKAVLDFEELRKMTSSAEIARVIQESGISEPLAVRALEIIRERRIELQDNAEAQRDLNQAEAESRLLQSDILLQQEALNKLEAEGVDLEKVLAELSAARLQNEIDNLRARLAVAEEGSAAAIQINKELNDKLLEQNQARLDEEKKQAEERKKQLEDLAKAAEGAFEILGDIADRRNEERIEAIDKEIEAEEKRVDRLRELAAEGNEDAQNNIALAEQRQAELELQREQQLQRQKQSELALTALQTYSGKVTAGDPNPLASTIADISVLRAFVASLPGFFHGTEDTGATGLLSDKYGKITGFTHENERVMTAEQNRLIGDMSNAELTALAVRENNRSQAPGWGVMVRELQELKQITRERPAYMGSDYDAFRDMMTTKTKKAGKLEKRHKKTGGIWGK